MIINQFQKQSVLILCDFYDVFLRNYFFQMNFSNKLISWYLENNRDLPWRQTKNPYYIWLSEIILQQTRVAQGLAYYEKFITAFPSIFDLANADEARVLKLWQGLGYYSRARNLHFTAKQIVNEFNGEFPNTYQEIIKLKGIGDYTASAIASICFDERTAVVDGNVYRVLARYFGIKTAINSTKGNKEFKALAQELIDPSNPGIFNQAIMDFGAIQCKPKKPLCMFCPFSDSCVALSKGAIDNLPVKEKKVKIKKRYFNYIVIKTKDNHTALEKRTGKGIWQGLYQFPLIESEHQLNEKELIAHASFNALFPEEITLSPFTKNQVVHKLSHQHLYTKFWIVEVASHNLASIRWNQVKSYPVPVLIANFLEEYIS